MISDEGELVSTEVGVKCLYSQDTACSYRYITLMTVLVLRSLPCGVACRPIFVLVLLTSYCEYAASRVRITRVHPISIRT